jgi:hypothetical protein
MVRGVELLTWNFSTTSATNAMTGGDTWTASFYVVAGAPTATVPVDACVTASCFAEGSGALSGLYSAFQFEVSTNLSLETVSFPVSLLSVEAVASGAPPPSTPAPVGVPGAPPPPLTLPSPPPPVPGFQPSPLHSSPNGLGVASVSIPALAAGLLAVGFARALSRGQKAVALRTPAGAMRSSSPVGAFEETTDERFGRFE